MTRRVGMTLIELLMVVAIIGILASVAVPKFRTVKRRAMATQILGDFDVIRVAAMSFYVDSGYFPKEAGSGKMPANLQKYLPNNFALQKENWKMDYENWTNKLPSKQAAKSGVVIGVSFTTSDQALGQTAMSLAGNSPTFTTGSKYTFLISGQ